MKIEQVRTGVHKVDSPSGNTYYVSVVSMECDVCGFLTYHKLCTCPDFLMGRPSRGINPFTHPCKHVTAVTTFEKEKKNGKEIEQG